MARDKAQVPDGAADTARRFGITIKALRLYEDMGLLRPARTGSGWRTYGRTEGERLHLILSLRQLGLPLARIAELARGDVHDLAAALEMQEAALEAQQAQTAQALALVRLARTRVASGATPSVEELAALVRRAGRGRLTWTPELEQLARKVFTPAQRRRISAGGGADQAALAVDWADLLRELAPVAAAGDPHSQAALVLARRAASLIDRMTGGDAKGWAAMQQFWRGAFDDPAVAGGDLPMDKAQWSFLSAAIAELFRRGELPGSASCND